MFVTTLWLHRSIVPNLLLTRTPLIVTSKIIALSLRLLETPIWISLDIVGTRTPKSILQWWSSLAHQFSTMYHQFSIMFHPCCIIVHQFSHHFPSFSIIFHQFSHRFSIVFPSIVAAKRRATSLGPSAAPRSRGRTASSLWTHRMHLGRFWSGE